MTFRTALVFECALLLVGCSSSAGAGGSSGSGGSGAKGGSVATGGSTNAAGTGSGVGTGGGSGGIVGGGGVPAACAASDAGNTPLGTDVFVPNTGMTAVDAITYTNVGATGAYAKVTHNWEAPACDGTCETRVYEASGALAPFNEDQTMVFAGPIEFYQMAVYYPANGGWRRVAYWDRCTTEGLAVVGNKWWHPCGGFFQSYVTADATASSDTPVQFAGSLAAGENMNVVSDTACQGTTDGTDCGWTQGLPLVGFTGGGDGSKVFATKFRMPIGSETPAYWILPGQVVRTSQYGCNCRGMGSDPTYKGGCGELDVAEILGGVTTSREATTTLYSFQDITGGGSVCFNRPVDETATFLVIFDAPSHQIAIRRLGATDFDFAGSIAASTVANWLASTGTERRLN